MSFGELWIGIGRAGVEFGPRCVSYASIPIVLADRVTQGSKAGSFRYGHGVCLANLLLKTSPSEFGIDRL